MPYTIEQHVVDGTTDYGWEPVPEGDFTNKRQAIAALHDLERTLGWRNLRVVSESDVIYTGLTATADED